MLIKIISAGQPGAEKAALDAAIELGIPHGGCVPRGYLADPGPVLGSYNLTEMPTKDPCDSMKQNILDSDGTAIFSHGELAGDLKLTANLATELRRPFLHIDLQKEMITEGSKILSIWVELHRIKVLNVAGPTADEDPRIYLSVRTAMEVALVFLREQKAWESFPLGSFIH